MSVENNDVLQRISSFSTVTGMLDRMDESVPIRMLSTENSASKLTTKNHCIETADYFSRIIQNFDLSIELQEALVLGSLTHDTGKGRLPAEILYGSNILTDEDRKLVATHPLWSARIIHDESQIDILRDNPQFLPEQWDTAIALAALHHTYKNNEDRNYPIKKLIRDLEKSKVVSKNAIEMINDQHFGELIAICDVYSAAGSRAYSGKRLAEEDLGHPNHARSREENASMLESIVKYEINTTNLGRQALKFLSEYYISIGG